MVIQCPECCTRFKISDGKIKQEGFRVRCAKCRHIFSVYPEKPFEPVEPSVVPPIPEPPGTRPPPDSTTKSESSKVDDLWGNLKEPCTPPSDARTRESINDSDAEEETAAEGDDWGSDEGDSEAFSTSAVEGPDDFDFTSDEKPKAEPTDEFLLFEDDEDAEVSAAEESTETPTEQPLTEDIWGNGEEDSEAFSTSAEESLDDFDFTSDERPKAEPTDEFLLFEDDEDAEVSAAGESTETPTEQPLTEDIWGNDEGDSEAFSTSAEESPDDFDFTSDEKPKTEPTDEFLLFEDDEKVGPSESSFDETGADDLFLSEDTANDSISLEESPPVAAKPGSSDGVAFGVEGSPIARSTEENNDFQFDGIEFDEEIAPTVTDTLTSSEATVQLQPVNPPTDKAGSKRTESAPEGQRKSPVASVLRVFFVLLMVMFAAAGYLVWQRGTADVGQIHLPLPNSFFTINKEAGQLFVVQGEAVNGYPETRSEISIIGMLHDRKKQKLMQQTVFCGNSLSLEMLNTVPFSQIEDAMNNQFGNALSNLNIASGKAIPYMIVFRNIPPDATAFTVEVADSKPGGPPSPM